MLHSIKLKESCYLDAFRTCSSSLITLYFFVFVSYLCHNRHLTLRRISFWTTYYYRYNRLILLILHGKPSSHYITLVMKCLIPNLPHCLEWAMVIRVTLAGRPGRRSAVSMMLMRANNSHGPFQFSNLSLTQSAFLG